MSRRRWIMLAGPPFLAAVAAIPGLGGGLGTRTGAVALDPPRSIAACPPGSRNAPPSSAVPGTWWRTEASLDAAGALDGWVLQVGTPAAPTTELRLSAASTVTGPAGGRVVVASEAAIDGEDSIVWIVDAVAGCAMELRIVDRIARRAVADPAGEGVLVHLLEPGTRGDLGVWRVGLGGLASERIVEPFPDSLREAAGMERAWVTDLRLDASGARLAVQSCHPDGCVTRIVDLATGRLEILDGTGQGPIVGFAGRQLVTWGACHGLPCPIVSWNAAGRVAYTIAPAAGGAALTGDGRLLAVLLPAANDELELVAIDLRSGATRSLGHAGRETSLLSGAAGLIAGLETAGATVAIGHAGLVPTPRSMDDDSATSDLPVPEVLP